MTPEQTISFIIFHIIPIWLFFGVLTLLCVVLCAISDNENLIKVLPENIIILLQLIVLGPISFMIITISYIKCKQEDRKEKRRTCGWWELKEFGGKY